MISTDHRKCVALFDEMAGVLLGSRFVQRMFCETIGVKLSWERDAPVKATIDGPDEESVRALVLTVRMFIQDGDGISFREMSEIYDQPSVPAELRSRFDIYRSGINQFLDATLTDIALNHNGQELTRRQILDVIVYGGLSHANPRRRATFEQWRTIVPWFALVWDNFMVTLAALCQCVRDIRDLNAELPGY